MKTKILIAVLSIGLFTALIVKSQETKQTQIKQELIDVTYTCPMHADVKSDQPGACPKCGMDLKKIEMKMDTTYTCPMHADIKSDKPGDCSKCGMELKEIGTNTMTQCCGGKDHSKMGMTCGSTKTEMHSDKTPQGCTRNDHSKMEMKPESTKTGDVTYACPMQCEGEKTYNKPGSCPKCNMDLKKQK